MYDNAQIARVAKWKIATVSDGKQPDEYARCDMANFICATGGSGDLFGETPVRGRDPVIKRKLAPELTTARVLCRQLRHKQARPDKKRIAHLICLNLLSILRHDSQRP